MSKLEIQNPSNLFLHARDEEILKEMFAQYQQIIVETELKGGFTVSRVFVIRPFKEPGKSELRAVVKIAPAYLIKKELQAYQTYIHNQLPKASKLQQSIFLNNWAGLRYQLEGEGIFKVESLLAYLCRTEINLEHVVEHTLKGRLFKSLGQLWRKIEKTQEGFLVRGSYDHLLPVNLVVSPLNEEALPLNITTYCFTPETIADQTLKSGDYIQLEGFEVTGVDPYETEPPEEGKIKEITLNCPQHRNSQPNSYRLRLQLAPKQDPLEYEIGQLFPNSVVGQVVLTRAEWLRNLVQQILNNAFDLTLETIPLTRPGKIIPLPVQLVNPLAKLPHILRQPLDVYISHAIHGDLNLENILVDPDTGNIYLIDFADARSDHRLHDLLRLEVGVVTRLLPLALSQANLTATNLLPEAIYHLFEQLHRAIFQPEPIQPNLLSPILEKPFVILAAIRQEAYLHLYNPKNQIEYYQGLTLYLLGTLKFRNLDYQGKRIAFWSAAAVQQLLQDFSSSTGDSISVREEVSNEASKNRKSGSFKHLGTPPLKKAKSQTMIWAKDGKEMVRVPASEFIYGGAKVVTPFSSSVKTLPEFWIDKTPVTNAEYDRFVSETGYKPPDYWKSSRVFEKIANHPVTGVSWEDVNSYARWAKKRLPTELEWEKAARGTDGRAYPWGNHSPTPELCNFGEIEGQTTAVGKYSPQGDSPYGCVDMAGNVWEWTLSSEDLFFLKINVFRGGSWFTDGKYLHVAHRNFTVTKTRPYLLGFRCVVVLKE